jgi:chromosome segregation ATPase
VRRKYTSRHLNPRIYRRWFIGDRAIPRQIGQREAQLDGIRQELLTLQAQDTALRARLALTQDKVRLFFALERDLPGLDDIPTLAAKLDAQRDELVALDTQTLEALQAEVEQCQATVDALQTEADQLERDTGGLQTRIETLSEETIPNLEREADQAVQDIKQFASASPWRRC